MPTGIPGPAGRVVVFDGNGDPVTQLLPVINPPAAMRRRPRSLPTASRPTRCRGRCPSLTPPAACRVALLPSGRGYRRGGAAGASRPGTSRRRRAGSGRANAAAVGRFAPAPGPGIGRCGNVGRDRAFSTRSTTKCRRKIVGGGGQAGIWPNRFSPDRGADDRLGFRAVVEAGDRQPRPARPAINSGRFITMPTATAIRPTPCASARTTDRDDRRGRPLPDLRDAIPGAGRGRSLSASVDHWPWYPETVYGVALRRCYAPPASYVSINFGALPDTDDLRGTRSRTWLAGNKKPQATSLFRATGTASLQALGLVAAHRRKGRCRPAGFADEAALRGRSGRWAADPGYPPRRAVHHQRSGAAHAVGAGHCGDDGAAGILACRQRRRTVLRRLIAATGGKDDAATGSTPVVPLTFSGWLLHPARRMEPFPLR